MLFHGLICLWLRNSGFALRQSRHHGKFRLMKCRKRLRRFAYALPAAAVFFACLHQNFIENACKLCYNTNTEESFRSESEDSLNNLKEIDWDSLTFANNYVFLEVMNNKKRCQYLIEKVLHIPIKKILHIAAERHTNSPRLSSKSIRLDVYVETLDGTVIDLEMQVTGKGSTVYKGKEDKQVAHERPLRTRDYQRLTTRRNGC